MGTIFPERRSSNLFGMRSALAILLMPLVADLLYSSASAQAPGGLVVESGVFVDPCMSGPKILSFAAQDASIGLGASTKLNWSVQACGYSLSMGVMARPQIDLTANAPPDWANWTSLIGITAPSQGSVPVQPAFNSVYQLVVAWGPNSAIFSAPIQVAVNLPLAHRFCADVTNMPTSLFLMVPKAGPTIGVSPGYSPLCRRKVTINANNLEPLLVQALGTPNTTVIIPDGIELDLTPYLGGPITVADGVQLVGGRIAEPGKPFKRGPRLYVTPAPYAWTPLGGLDPAFNSHWPDPLFQIVGDNVRISGVRLEGPGAPPDAWRASKSGETRGIKFVDRINVEIDHNEFSGWNTAAVEPTGIELPTGPNDRVWQMWTSNVTGDASGIHYPAGLEPVSIHDNYFHSNWYSTTPEPWSSSSQANRDACMP